MKISFCTTCMDRLFHLKQTYLCSLENTRSYSQREFILLNYNSKDDIDEWVLNNLEEFIKTGLVKYYKTTEPTKWFAAHAKNVSQKVATGDILVNLDCDNILVQGYCEYLQNLFARKDIIVASESADLRGNNGCCGMISSFRDHFYNVRGYDENYHDGWCMDDTNYQYRCRMHNHLELIIQDKKYSHCLDHSNEIRTKNCINKNIFETRKESQEILNKIAISKNYIVNKSEWGKAKLIFNFAEHLEI